MSFEISLRNIPIVINIGEVRRYLGEYRGITLVSNEIHFLIERLIAQSKAFISAAIFSKSLRIKSKGENLVETEELVLPGKDIAKLLKDSIEVIVCATTIGEALEREVDELTSRKRFLEATILDAIGSTAADTAMDYLNNLLIAEATRRKLKLTRRYSPGYGDLPLLIQGELLKVLGGDSLGIRVSPSYMLIPRKSVTALIGVMEG